MLGLLDHGSGQVRHYTVKALLDLGENRREVILKLVQGLADPVASVRDEVKKALEKMAGLHQSICLFLLPQTLCFDSITKTFKLLNRAMKYI